MASPQIGTLAKVGDSVTFTGTAGNGACFAGLYGTFTGLTVLFTAAPLGSTSFSPATAKSRSGGGGHSQWTPASNTPNMWDLSDLQAGSSLKVTCLAISSGSAQVGISSTPFQGTQTVPYSASITPDTNQGSVLLLTVTDTNGITMNAPTNPVAGDEIMFEILNSSGGSMGTITWNAIYKLAGAFTNPASTKRRTICFKYDGSSWIELARAAADI